MHANLKTQKFSKKLNFWTEDDMPVGTYEKYGKSYFFAALKSVKKGVGSGVGSGSGSISLRYESEDPDPDPHQNVTDPQL